jgi:hypothetical protein
MIVFAKRTIKNKVDATFTDHALARLDDGKCALVDTAGLPDEVFIRVPLAEEAALAVLHKPRQNFVYLSGEFSRAHWIGLTPQI